MTSVKFLIICSWVTLLLALPAYGHKFSTAYMDVKLDQGQPLLIWKVALHDLAQARLINAKNHHQVSWQQVLDSAAVVDDYLAEHLSFSNAGQPCQIRTAAASEWQLQRIQRDVYLILPMRVSCETEHHWQLSYTALFVSEPSHKLLLAWQIPGSSANAVLSEDSVSFPSNSF